MNKHTKKWLVGGAIGLAVLFAAAFVIVSIVPRDSRIRLEEYGKSERVSIDDKEYEKMIADKRSFVVFIDKLGCLKTADISTWFEEFPSEMQFKYYDLNWDYVKNTSLHGYVKYTPSIALIRRGEVVTWLKADSDEDEPYYNDPEALKAWLRTYIQF